MTPPSLYRLYILDSMYFFVPASGYGCGRRISFSMALLARLFFPCSFWRVHVFEVRFSFTNVRSLFVSYFT